jgi:hypothetical protein
MDCALGLPRTFNKLFRFLGLTFGMALDMQCVVIHL